MLEEKIKFNDWYNRKLLRIVSLPCVCVCVCARVHVHARSLSPSVQSDSLWPHRPQPARLLRPWDFISKNIGPYQDVMFLELLLFAIPHAKQQQFWSGLSFSPENLPEDRICLSCISCTDRQIPLLRSPKLFCILWQPCDMSILTPIF